MSLRLRLTPAEVCQAILRAPVDLLWNGGIGTFVKAAEESHDEVGDRANDAIRIDGRELRARVVAEGGNLGATQAGRIEYALAGGHINTDAIDNSAGVDCSDHEVNLKILVDLAVERGLLAAEARNPLLAELADDVCAQVLYDNYLQVQILSQEEAVASDRLESHEALMESLEADGALDRALEFLPSAELVSERARAGRGLTRPELCVLMGFAKLALREHVLRSTVPDDPFMERELRAYFPRRVLDATGDLYREHPLRREIAATIATNEVINDLGISWVWRCVAETGAEHADVVRAFYVARAVSHAKERWDAIEALFADPRVDTETQMELMRSVDWLVESLARWYLRERDLERPDGPDRARRAGLHGAGGGAPAARHARVARRARAAARGLRRPRRDGRGGRGDRLAPRADLRARHHRGRAQLGQDAVRGGDRLLHARRAAAPRLARAGARRGRAGDAAGSAGPRRRSTTTCGCCAARSPSASCSRRRASPSSRRSSTSWPGARTPSRAWSGSWTGSAARAWRISHRRSSRCVRRARRSPEPAGLRRSRSPRRARRRARPGARTSCARSRRDPS